MNAELTALPAGNVVRGTVSRVEGDMAVVDVVRSSGCGRCHEPGGCGGTNLATGAACVSNYRLANTIGAKPGEEVLVAVPPGSILKAVAWAYGVPGGLMLVGAGMSTAVIGSDMAALAGAAAGLATGFVLLRLARRKAGQPSGQALLLRFEK